MKKNKTTWREKENIIYHKNMQVLRQRYPLLAKRVEKCLSSGKFSLSVGPNIYLHKYKQEYYLSGKIDQDAENTLLGTNLKNPKMVVFLGLGLGYELLIYAGQLAASLGTRYILVVEKELEIFCLALTNIDLTRVLSNPWIEFLVDLPEEEIYLTLRTYLLTEYKFIYAKALKAVAHNSAFLLNKDYYLKILRTFREASVDCFTHYGNDPEDSLIGIVNMLANLKVILENQGIKELKNKFFNRPAVIVSTGPSLNKNKHLLKEVEEKALIISVDASLKILLEMGVKPHLVTSLERVPQVEKLISGLSPEEVKEVYFAACPVVRPQVYQAYPGPKIIVYRNFDHFKWLGVEKGILEIKQSAGNMAFKVAEYLGCNPIILIGQDLALSREGETHAQGAVYGEKQTAFYRNLIEVTGNDGKPIKTNATLYTFLKSYQEDIARYRGLCINSTEGGAYIPGTTVMPFAQSIEKHLTQKIYPLKTINEACPGVKEEKIKQDWEKVEKIIRKTQEELKVIESECVKGLAKVKEISPVLLEIINQKQDGPKIINKLKNMEQEVLNPRLTCLNYPSFQLFLTHVLQSFLLMWEVETNAVPEKYDQDSSGRAEILLRYHEWYATVGKITAICQEKLNQAGSPPPYPPPSKGEG